MRIILAHKYFKVGGGGDYYFFETKRILEENGHAVAVFSTLDKDNEPTPYSDYFVEAPDFQNPNMLKRVASIGKIIYSLETKKNISRLISDFHPDIVHAFGIHSHLSPSLADACRLNNVPLVLTCNDYKHICPNYKLYHHNKICFDCRTGNYFHAILNRCCHDSMQFSIANAMEAYVQKWANLLRKNVHTFLFTSNFMAQTTELFWGKGNYRWKKIGNPYDSPSQKKSNEFGEYILYFGRFIEEKGVDVLMKAVQNIPNVKLKLVGNGPDEEALKQLMKDLRISNIELLGPRWGKDLDALLAQTRFVVVPSVWHENYPYVILQSFAVGKPVIGTDRGGIPELIQDRVTGLICKGGDPGSLGRAIQELWNNPDECRTMGNAAKEFADMQFNDQKYYRDLMEIYGEIVQ